MNIIIKLSIIAAFPLSFLISYSANAQQNPDQIFPKGNKAAAAHVNGDAWANQLVAADIIFNVQVLNAYFAPKARTRWLIHPGRQIILVTAGTGYYQEKGEQAQLLHKGDVVKCAPSVQHWLGAAPDKALYTINITTNPRKGDLVLLNEVTDNEYDHLNIK
jgi:quercetin dioxygenase-like cupin family protein